VSAQGIRAGRAFVEIGAVDKFSAVLERVEAKMKSVSASVAAAAAAAAAPGLAIAIPFSNAIKQFAAFDDGMRAAGSIAGAVGNELASLTHVAEDLGRTTSFTAAQISSLMTEFGKIGFNPSQIKAATAAILDLARATGTDVSNASTIVGTALNQFGLDATKTAMVADMLAKTANVTASSVESIGYGMSYAGVISKQLGTSMEETLAIMGQLANAGIDGTSAGTDLRRIQAIVKSQAAMMKEAFNVDTRDAQGNLKPLIQVLNEIGVATANLDAEAKATKFEEVFGLLGMTSSMVLSSAATNVDKLAEQIRNSGGDAKRTAEEMDKGIGGAMRRVESAVEGVQLAIGKNLAGAFSSLANAFVRVLGDVTVWIEKNQTAVVAIGAFSAASIALGGVLLTVAAAIQAVAIAALGIVAINYLSVAFFGATAGVVIFSQVLQAAGFITAGVNLIFAATTGGLRGMGQGIKAAAMGLVTMQARMHGTSGAAVLTTVSTRAMNGAMATTPWYATLASIALSMFRAALTAITTPGSLFTKTLAGMRKGLADVASTARMAWVTVLSPLLVFAAKAAVAALVVYGIGKAFMTAARQANVFGGLFSTLGAQFSKLLAIVKGTFGGVMTAISNGNYGAAVGIMWQGIKAAFWTGVETVMEIVKYFIVNGIGEFFRFGQSLLSVLWNAFKAIPGLLWKAVRGGMSLAEILKDALSGNVETYLDAYSGVSRMQDASVKRLSEMNAEQEQLAKSAKMLADQEERLKSLREAAKEKDQAEGKTDPQTAQQEAADRDRMSTEDRAKFDANQAEIKRLEEQLRASGATAEDLARLKAESDQEQAAYTDAEARAIAERIKLLEEESKVLADRDALKSEQAKQEALKLGDDLRMQGRDESGQYLRDKPQTEAEAENAKAIQERIAALRDEANSLRDGEDAAERMKFARNGATEAELAAYDAAMATKQAAEMDADIQDRITALQEEAFELKNGADAAERHKLALMGATSAQLKALKIAQDTAEQARKADQLKQDGASLKDALRNPLEVFRDEWAKFNEMRAAGAIDDETLGRARDKAREDLFGNTKDEEDRRKAFEQERARIARETQAGTITEQQGGQQLAMISALLEEAQQRAASAGERMSKLTGEGTFSGFAVGRMSGQSKTEQLQSRIATAAEKNVEETIKTRVAIEKQQGTRLTQ
jgi:TP901 family phage tail tape measure protein